METHETGTAYYLIAALLFFGGAFCAFSAFKNYDWFMEHRKAWLFVKLFGRSGARAIYIVLGLAMMAGGILFTVPLLFS